jgi:hypothetical protein
MTVDLKPPPTFSDSPWFWDGSLSSLPEPEANVVQVSESPYRTRKSFADKSQCHFKKRVAYYHPKDVGNYHYGVSMNDDTGKLVRRETVIDTPC